MVAPARPVEVVKIVVVLGYFGDHPIIEEATVLIAHGRVLDLAHRDLSHIADIDPLQDVFGIGAEEAKFPEGRHIDGANVIAHVFDFLPASKILGKIAGALPDADSAENSPRLLLGIMERGPFEDIMGNPGVGCQQSRRQRVGGPLWAERNPGIRNDIAKGPGAG